MSKVKSTILQVLLMIVLIAIIAVEIILTYRVWFNRSIRSIDVITQAAADAGKKSVSIDILKDYEELTVVDDGEVIPVTKDGKVRIKVNGVFTDSSYADYGYYYYTDVDGTAGTLKVNELTQDADLVRKAVHDYWYGDTSSVIELVAAPKDDGGLEYYMCKVASGNHPVVYSPIATSYYMLLCTDKKNYVVTAPHPFVHTAEKATAHFSDPSEDPQMVHSYSPYEELAAENTIRNLQDAEEGTVVNNPYQSTTDLTGGQATYMSANDKDIRNQLMDLGMHSWNKDGTSATSTTKIDTTSESAKKSQWDIYTMDTYSYVSNGLRISSMHANRDDVRFSVGGNINNLLSAEREYVILVKFINASNELLGIKVADYRAMPLSASGVSTFEVDITADVCDIAGITGVQFEVY